MKYTFFILFFVGLLGLSSPVFAQFNVVPQDDVDVSMVPENPGPNQVVTASVVSYSTNIDFATVTWKINGKVKSTGQGVKTFTFVTGSMNTSTILDITVLTAEGQTIQKTITIKPASVDLIWQSNSFVPPFYKGKPLFSYQNQITFIALPHMTGPNGAEIGSKNLVYKWTLNSSVVDSASGYGRDSFTLTGSLIARPLNVTVEVTSAGDDGLGTASMTVAPITPSVVMYEKNPLYGIQFQSALTNTVSLSGTKEIMIVGMPFFFGTTNLYAPELSYTWAINGTPINDGRRQPTQIFRQVEGSNGRSNISLQVDNSSKILQSASNTFNLTFGI